jgi:hypothetical protein
MMERRLSRITNESSGNSEDLFLEDDLNDILEGDENDDDGVVADNNDGFSEVGSDDAYDDENDDENDSESHRNDSLEDSTDDNSNNKSKKNEGENRTVEQRIEKERNAQDSSQSALSKDQKSTNVSKGTLSKSVVESESETRGSSKIANNDKETAKSRKGDSNARDSMLNNTSCEDEKKQQSKRQQPTSMMFEGYDDDMDDVNDISGIGSVPPPTWQSEDADKEHRRAMILEM